MKTKISAVRKILREAARKSAHHQIASRHLAMAVKFAEINPQAASAALEVARFEAQFVAGGF
jgi:DNA-directed RNA polymerase subunit F